MTGTDKKYLPPSQRPKISADASQHLHEVSKAPGYLRCTRFKLLGHRSNAQSRFLEGLPPRDADPVDKDPPPYLAIHEFETESIDPADLKRTTETEWAKKILADAKAIEMGIWDLKGRFGDGKFF